MTATKEKRYTAKNSWQARTCRGFNGDPNGYIVLRPDSTGGATVCYWSKSFEDCKLLADRGYSK